MRTLGKILVLLMLINLLGALTQKSQAQVGSIAKKAGESAVGFFSGEGGGGSTGLALEFFLLFPDAINGIALAHKNLLARKREEPWLVSLEGILHAGYYTKFSTINLLPSLRGNWGLFSTQIRLNRLQDRTGFYKTLDWQILQLNLVARPMVGFRVGVGTMHEYETDQTHTEYFFGLDFHFNDRKINPVVEYRLAKDYGSDTTPRWEINTRVDYLVMTVGRFDINLMAGFVFQQYYSTIDFYFFQTGLNILLY